MRARSPQIQGAWLAWFLLVGTAAAQDTQPPAESAPPQGIEGADEASPAPQAEGPSPALPSQAATAPVPTASSSEPAASAPSTVVPLPTQIDVVSPSEEAALAAELEAASRANASDNGMDLAKPELLRFYGFLDFGARYFYDVDAAPQGKPVLFTPTGRESGGWSFTPATTNLYIDAQPLPSTRALVELRFALQGSDPKRPRYVASTADVSSPFAQGISSVATLNIERVQIEQHIFDWFQLRAGMWLTPFGIWNEDHGTPTLISMYLPQFILNEQIPLRQVGVQSYGGARIGDYRVDYNAYVSNGRLYSVSAGGTEASIHDVVDYDSDKSFGYRLRFSRSYPFYFHLSNAFYYGRYEEISREIETATGPGTGKTVGWREYSIALDAALDYKGMRLRSEFIVTAARYEPGFEPTYREGVQPDRNQYDGYLLAAYRLQPGLPQLEPYFYWEIARRPSGIGDTFVIGSVGLNYYLSSVSQLKIQWITAAFFDWNSKPGAAWLGLPTRSNDYHTGKDLPSATGSPGAISARYVLTF